VRREAPVTLCRRADLAIQLARLTAPGRPRKIEGLALDFMSLTAKELRSRLRAYKPSKAKSAWTLIGGPDRF
jgi:hypothetical protein